MTDQDSRDHPDLDFRSPPLPLPNEDESTLPRTLLAIFNDGECRAWVAAILAMRSRRNPPDAPPG
jgi:hypothetical protein